MLTGNPAPGVGFVAVADERRGWHLVGVLRASARRIVVGVSVRDTVAGWHAAPFSTPQVNVDQWLVSMEAACQPPLPVGTLAGWVQRSRRTTPPRARPSATTRPARRPRRSPRQRLPATGRGRAPTTG